MSVFFSIIIPTFQQHQYISDCIKGFLNQSYTDFEVIISDDSEDELTANVCNAFFDERIRYFHNKPRLGRVENYRVCVAERALGKWCIICDGDDYFTDRDYLQYVKHVIQDCPELVLIQAGHKKGTHSDHYQTELPEIEGEKMVMKGIDYLLHFRKFNHFSHMSTVSRLEVLKVISPFQLPILSTDLDTYLRLSAHGSVCLLKRDVGFWRQHAANASGTDNLTDQFVNLRWINNVFNYWFQSADPSQQYRIHKWRNWQLKGSLLYLLKWSGSNSTRLLSWLFEFVSISFQEGYLRILLSSGNFYVIVIGLFKKRLF